MLWSQISAPAPDAFKELLLELAHERSLDQLLPLVTQRLAEHEDVALARLWLIGPGDQCESCPNAAACSDRSRCLHLVASTSRSLDGATVSTNRLNGDFRRIPIGAFKVGAVAAAGAPVVVTDPGHDPKIRRPEWVRAEQIAGFAGLPLDCRGERLGVLGVFVRAPITDAAVDVLRIVANHTAAAIATARAVAEVTEMRQQILIESGRLLRQVNQSAAVDELIGDSAQMREVRRQIAAVAATDAGVLILGESGTGKELAARAIHRSSPRAGGPFVELNCAAIPRELAETELFGHVRGAFSGATRDRIGRFEAAEGGTLFLDEVGELPPELQAKLLRVLQEGTYERVGDVRTRRTDVRIVAATNRNLLVEVDAGRFRQDLYYRLAIFPVSLPPLRERRDDLPALVDHLLSRICRRLHRPPLSLTGDQLRELACRRWPGNVRELLNLLERAVISAKSDEDLIFTPVQEGDGWTTRHLPQSSGASVAVPALEGPLYPARSPDEAHVVPDLEMRRLERDNLRRALARTGGKIYGPDGAAALLGVKPTTLASRLKRLHIETS
ncbi:MAG TPA: sigma 54-interacting transcriptional regulator [Polyangia bacterium]|nr:sigma 54-interacting transcriptional regulator [Polyangia bacterium]